MVSFDFPISESTAETGEKICGMDRNMNMEIRENTGQSFHEFYLAYYGLIRAYLVKKTGNFQDAEDLAQEAFTYCSQKWDSYDPEKASRKTWLFLIVRSRWKNYCRSRKNNLNVDDFSNVIPDGTDLEQALWISQVREAIADAMEKLPENQRKAVLLRYFSRWDDKRIAGALGVSDGNARIMIHRGLKKLEKLMPEEIRRTMDL